MKLVIHAEVEGGDSVKAYEGESFEEAKAFVDGLDKVAIIQCNLFKQLDNGETRSLGNKAKGELAPALLSDIKAWLNENE